MLFAIFFTFWRFMEIITLIPTVGILSYFVNGFVSNNELTPNYVVILFIVSVIAVFWAIFTLFSYHRSSTNAQFVALIDLGFVGALIAGVYALRFVASADCTTVGPVDWGVSLGPFGYASGSYLGLHTDKTCGMLKACFALGIMNCTFFFFTAVLAWMHGGRMSRDERDRVIARETHARRTSRGSHRRARSGSHQSHRSSHSHRQSYV